MVCVLTTHHSKRTVSLHTKSRLKLVQLGLFFTDFHSTPTLPSSTLHLPYNNGTTSLRAPRSASGSTLVLHHLWGIPYHRASVTADGSGPTLRSTCDRRWKHGETRETSQGSNECVQHYPNILKAWNVYLFKKCNCVYQIRLTVVWLPVIALFSFRVDQIDIRPIIREQTKNTDQELNSISHGNG